MAILQETEPKYDILSDGFRRNPYPTFDRMREEDPVYWHPTLGMWFLTRYEDVQGITRDPRFSLERLDELVPDPSPEVLDMWAVVRDFFGSWFFFMDPPRHTALRSLVSKAFTPRATEALRPFIEQEVKARIDEILARGNEAELVADLAFRIPSAVISHMLGVPKDHQSAFKGWSDAIFTVPAFTMDRDEAVRTAYKGVVSLESYLRGLIEARRHEPTDDILSALVHATDDGRSLTERELVSTCSMLLVAGHETTTNLIGSSILAVLRNPDQMALLLEQPGLVDEAVDEFLRYDGPTIQIARLALEDVEMGGQVISKGQVAFGFGSAANHDPTVFRDPDRLDLLRPDKNRHLGFAHGPHYCLGAAIARLESGIAIREVVLRFPSLALATNDLHWMDSLAMRGLTALPVRFAT